MENDTQPRIVALIDAEQFEAFLKAQNGIDVIENAEWMFDEQFEENEFTYA